MNGLDNPTEITTEKVGGKTILATFWIIAGHGWGQMCRFLSNLILTRLLRPADFGLMQLVYAFVIAINMFSDLGLNTNILQHARGEDTSFLKTAWTIQVIRGFVIELFLLLIAIPVAQFYNAPDLSWLIPAAGLSAIISGFVSTSLLIHNRKIDMKRLTMIEIVSQTIGVLAMVAVAWIWPRVWALLVSSLVASLIKTVLSHYLFPDPPMAFELNKKDTKEIFHFSRWIFISSFATFILGRFDRLILGVYLSLGELGIYGIAVAIPAVILEVIYSLGSSLLVPLYARLAQVSLTNLKQHSLKIRISLTVPFVLLSIAMIIWGPALIRLLYPKEYHDAGWMLQILSVSAAIKCVMATIGPVQFAMGDSFRAMLQMVISSILLIGSMLAAAPLFGVLGLLWAIPFADLLAYPFLIFFISRYRFWLPQIDIPLFVLIFFSAWFFIIS